MFYFLFLLSVFGMRLARVSSDSDSDSVLATASGSGFLMTLEMLVGDG